MNSKASRTPAATRRPPAGVRLSHLSGLEWYALALGLFLGLAIWKFGNPVILDRAVGTPATWADAVRFAWPVRWAYLGLIPLLLIGAGLAWTQRTARRRRLPWLWVLPLVWFAWQLVSATRSLDAELTRVVWWLFAGCLGCYFVGMLVLAREVLWPWLLVGLLTAFTWCLIRAANQKFVEFPREHAELLLGERTGWTNFTAEAVAELRVNQIIITTNGVAVANPQILAKYAKGRVSGTVVYPNALAGLVLLLFPVSLGLAVSAGQRLRPWIRSLMVTLTIFLGVGGLLWTGSKLGWLIGLGMMGLWVMRFNWSRKLRWTVVAGVVIVGLGFFAWRFQGYFSTGAKSASARVDYWRAAVQVFAERPMFGSGPGTFQRRYEAIKAPESEMARLVHNDYLEQFSDSGLVGGVAYLGWILLALMSAGRQVLTSHSLMRQTTFLGVLGWFVQGLGEFSLYVPALSWTAFCLLGMLVAAPEPNPMDSHSEHT